MVAIINKQKIGDCSKRFCRGAGDGFCDVVILIAAAALFAAGMKSIGLTGALVDSMKGSQSVAMFAAASSRPICYGRDLRFWKCRCLGF